MADSLISSRAVAGAASPAHAATSQANGYKAAGSLQSGLTINAAFLKEIKDDNRQLKTLWDRVGELVAHRQVASNHYSELVELVQQLCDQMAIHFSLEEAYGYFDDAVDVAPHRSVEAQRLRAQHPGLFTQIQALSDQIAQIDRTNLEKLANWIERFDVFQCKFQRHEEAELNLILDSFDDDLGVGD